MNGRAGFQGGSSGPVGPCVYHTSFRGMLELPVFGEQRVAATTLCGVEHAKLGEESRQHRWSRGIRALWKMQVRKEAQEAHCGDSGTAC